MGWTTGPGSVCAARVDHPTARQSGDASPAGTVSARCEPFLMDAEHAQNSSAPVSPAEVVTRLWARIDERDWVGAGELLAPGVVVEWPVSRERMRGRGNYLAVQSEYPEGWAIRVLRVVGGQGEAASEVEVPMEGVGVFRVASFWQVREGLVVAGTEYWSGPETDPSPSWRAAFVERY